MQEWYLMNGTNESASGYENGVFNDFNVSSFSEILQSHVAKDLVLYNHDLSEQTAIRGVIQGNTADTQLKSLERTILCEIGTLSAGMYVYYDDAYWIVTGRPDNNGFYEKSTLSLCNWLLKWQDKNGNIISRWAVVEGGGNSDGEDGSKTIVLGSDQFSIMVPIDEQSVKIPREVKFFIDYNNEDPTVYQLTNPSNVLYRYGENNGVTHWIVKEVPYSPSAEDLAHGVCNYIAEPIPPQEGGGETLVFCNITGNSELKIGRSRTYTAEFTDENGEDLDDVEFQWNINCDFVGDIESTVDGYRISLVCDNSDLAEESFVLEVVINDEVISHVDITLSEMF